MAALETEKQLGSLIIFGFWMQITSSHLFSKAHDSFSTSTELPKHVLLVGKCISGSLFSSSTKDSTFFVASWNDSNGFKRKHLIPNIPSSKSMSDVGYVAMFDLIFADNMGVICWGLMALWSTYRRSDKKKRLRLSHRDSFQMRLRQTLKRSMLRIKRVTQARPMPPWKLTYGILLQIGCVGRRFAGFFFGGSEKAFWFLREEI